MHTTRPLTTLVLALVLGAPSAAQAPAVQTPAVQTPAVQTPESPADPAAVEAAAEPEVVMLRLRDGAIHWGSIAEHDPDGVRFTLLRHGGQVRVPWSLVDPVQEHELRERFGYVDVSSEELLIPADRIQLRDGVEIVGVILSREGDNLLVKVDGNLQAIPKDRVAQLSSGHPIPALDVYSREEIYGQYLGNTPPDDAAAQIELAHLCEQILDFAHAVEHYAEARAIDPDLREEEVQFALERARLKAERQGQIDYLREAEVHRKRGRFDDAIAHLEGFGTQFPDSPLHLDAAKKRDAILRGRDAAIRDLVQSRWHYWLGRLARSAARDMQGGYAGAVAYAEEQLSEDIQVRVLEDVQSRISADVPAEQILAFWEQRRKVRYLNATYGDGTWLLGEEGALAGSEAAEEQVAPSETDEVRRELADKVNRFLKNLELARKARGGDEEADDQEAFWRGFSVNKRAQWIRACYAERSGDLELRPHPYLRSCPECAGRGAREVLYVGAGGQSTGGSQIVRCPTCRGVRVHRRVYYR